MAPALGLSTLPRRLTAAARARRPSAPQFRPPRRSRLSRSLSCHSTAPSSGASVTLCFNKVDGGLGQRWGGGGAHYNTLEV